MSARGILRSETRGDHERVDALFSQLDLADPAQYRRFLAAQAGPFLAVEDALDRADIGKIVEDWPARRRGTFLQSDLGEFGMIAAPEVSPSLPDPSSQLGALYVLEGSRLGGAMLRRAIPVSFPRRFLGAEAPKGSWPKLLEILEEHLYGSERIGLAVEAAKAVFARFEAAGRRFLEIEPA